MKDQNRPVLLPAVVLLIAAAGFGSIPFLLSRRTEGRQQAAAKQEAAVAAPAATAPKWTVEVLGGTLVFDDVAKQSREFIDDYHTIRLTPAQEAIKAAALKAMPAACCNDSSAYTCCCPCNLSKTIWGLSHYAIAKLGANAAEVREVVEGWLRFTNPDGYRGNACHVGGCGREFRHDGCGGMREEELVL